MIRVSTSEDNKQLKFLGAAPGEPESGFVRYAAAMYFHQRGMISDAALEVFRFCSRLDGEDPMPILRQLGLSSEIQL